MKASHPGAHNGAVLFPQVPAAGFRFVAICSASDQEIDYRRPELYVFEADTLHGWSDVVEDMLLPVCQAKSQ
jgi:hypothetical protein